jgi:holo-[acyl-carrier protein] synthase
MIVGTGIDIAEVPRIRRSIERFGARFLQRIYTAGEIRYCDSKANRVERYAARFAAKEAAMKALGTAGATACAGAIARLCACRAGVPQLLSTARPARLPPGWVQRTPLSLFRTPPTKPSRKSFWKTKLLRTTNSLVSSRAQRGTLVFVRASDTVAQARTRTPRCPEDTP